MRISYIANIRLPTEKAHGYQIMRVCAALAQLGHDVHLFVPAREEHPLDAFTFYGLEKNFALTYVRCFPWMRYVKYLGRFSFFLQSFSFLRALKRASLDKNSIVYTRDAEAVWYLSRRGIQCIYNAHTLPRRAYLTGFLIGQARGAVCNSRGTQAALKAVVPGIPSIVAYNASDPNPFVGTDKTQLRAEAGLSVEGPLVMYTGHLYGWKGVETLIACAPLMPDVTFALLGGTLRDVEMTRGRIKNLALANVMVLGWKPKTEVPKYLVAADVLALPNTPETKESVQFTSPLKLFEYMASGVPIVASDLPSLRETLSDAEAFLVPPGDAQALSDTIRHMLADKEAAQARASRALAEAGRHTWEAHAASVADFMQSVLYI